MLNLVVHIVTTGPESDSFHLQRPVTASHSPRSVPFVSRHSSAAAVSTNHAPYTTNGTLRDAVVTSSRRSLLSSCNIVARYMRKCTFIYPRKESTAYPSPISIKLTNVQFLNNLSRDTLHRLTPESVTKLRKAGRISVTLECTVWPISSRFLRKWSLPGNLRSSRSIPNFIKIWRKYWPLIAAHTRTDGSSLKAYILS